MPAGRRAQERVARVAQPSEAEFTRMVMAAARLHGWLAYHPLPLRTAKGWRTGTQGDPGFPDLVLARAGAVILAELKVPPNTRDAAQERWAAAAGAELWRPADWDRIVATLGG